MSNIDVDLAIIKEKVIRTHEDVKEIKKDVKRINGGLRKNTISIAVLEDENKSTKYWTRFLGAAFLGGIVTKFFGLW